MITNKFTVKILVVVNHSKNMLDICKIINYILKEYFNLIIFTGRANKEIKIRIINNFVSHDLFEVIDNDCQSQCE